MNEPATDRYARDQALIFRRLGDHRSIFLARDLIFFKMPIGHIAPAAQRSTPDFHGETGNVREMLEVIRDQNHLLGYRV